MIYPITAAMVVYADETNCSTTADLRWSQMSDGLRCEAKRSQTTKVSPLSREVMPSEELNMNAVPNFQVNHSKPKREVILCKFP